MKGWRLAVSSGMFFLLPLALAILGATLGGADRNLQCLGGALGLVVGMVLAGLVGRWLRPPVAQCPAEPNLSTETKRG